MKTAERIVLYTGLALSLSLAAGYQWMASPAVASAPARAADTRIATIDILGITEKMILSEKYLSARNTNTTSQNKMLEDLSKGLQDVIARAGATQENTPERRALEQEFNSKQEELRRAQAQAQAQIEQFNTLQVAECYRAVITAANRLGAELGYTHVISTRTGEPTIRSNNVAGAVQEILARPVVLGPLGDDLTERLTRQLGLENVVAQPVPAGATPGTAPATPATPVQPNP
jgi:Skp family chaperone for outer membrane proteins